MTDVNNGEAVKEKKQELAAEKGVKEGTEGKQKDSENKKKDSTSERARTTSDASTGSNMSSPKANESDASDGDRSRSSSDVDKRERSASTSSGPIEGRQRTASMVGARVVVLAVDASENSKFAFDWYLENIFRVDDYIVLVHCPEPPKLPTFNFKSGLQLPVEEWKKVLDEVNLRTRKLEEEYEGTCIQKKLRYKVRGEAMKKPGEGICKIAEEERANIIVIGTRGLGHIKRTLLGSVSDYVVRNTSVPVVVVPVRKMRRRESSFNEATL